MRGNCGQKDGAHFETKTCHILEIYFSGLSGSGVTPGVLELVDQGVLIVGMICAGETERCGHSLLALRDAT